MVLQRSKSSKLQLLCLELGGVSLGWELTPDCISRVPRISHTWGVETKSTKFQVLADSYVGVFPEYKAPASQLINYYGGCGLVDFPESMVSDCEAETATVTEMVSALMNEAPNTEWLFIDSIADKTQRMFYELVLLSIAEYPFTNLLPADEFYGNMAEILDAYSVFMNVTRFNIDSDQHVWLTGNNYASAADMQGELLGDILSAWLSYSSGSSSSDSSMSSSSSPFASSLNRSSVSSSSGSSMTSSSTSSSTPSSNSSSSGTSRTIAPSSSSMSSSKASPSSTANTTSAPIESPGSTTTTRSETNTTSSPTEIPTSPTSSPLVSTTVGPTETPVSTTTTPMLTPATTEPTVDIPTYC
ncbi:hypothetical protein PF008_g20527 [Phytophthora fragariae]|uniref:Uncharacterized protein n=1 Tax=Phytophthora fragariae TaxID=53985 RepID=A0A6G0QZ74_9STRA|nr:hypothetical protein PF008_g20527 [Phytophthora fragariae]